MTTVAELIQYLQTLPPETAVEVAVDGSYQNYTEFEDLHIPDVAEGLNPADYSSNMEFNSYGTPSLFFGRT